MSRARTGGPPPTAASSGRGGGSSYGGTAGRGSHGARVIVPRQDLAAQAAALAVLLFLRLLHLQCILVLRLLRLLLLLTILDREVRLRDLACEGMTGVNIGLTLVS